VVYSHAAVDIIELPAQKSVGVLVGPRLHYTGVPVLDPSVTCMILGASSIIRLQRMPGAFVSFLFAPLLERLHAVIYTLLTSKVYVSVVFLQ